MYVDDTSILNTGHKIKELQITTSKNTGLAEQYFEVNNLSIKPTKTHVLLTKQSMQGSDLQILIMNREQGNSYCIR
jgi:hypothetical protein